MKKLFKYKNNTLQKILPLPKEIDIKWWIWFLNEAFKDDWYYFKIWDDSVFHCSDEMDWKESECCNAPIRNWLCSDCKENC